MPTRRLPPLWIVAASIVATLATSVCRGASIVEVSPRAIHPSEPTEIDIHLHPDAVAWIGANPQIVAPVDLATESLTLPTHDKPVWKVRVRPKTPLSADHLTVRIRSDRAVTDPWLLAVDSLPTVTLLVENSTAGVEREITIPCGIDGKTREHAVQLFRFRATAGEVIRWDLLGDRLGSDIDGILVVRDSKFREVAYADDHEETGADPVLEFQCPTSGNYLVEVRDASFGGDLAYRLRGCYVQNPVEESPTRSANPFAEGYRVFREIEPNQDSQQSTVVTLPCHVQGRIDQSNKVDTFSFICFAGSVAHRSPGGINRPVRLSPA